MKRNVKKRHEGFFAGVTLTITDLLILILVYTIQVSFMIKVCDSINLFQRLKTGLHYPSFFDQSV